MNDGTRDTGTRPTKKAAEWPPLHSDNYATLSHAAHALPVRVTWRMNANGTALGFEALSPPQPRGLNKLLALRRRPRNIVTQGNSEVLLVSVVLP